MPVTLIFPSHTKRWYSIHEGMSLLHYR